jgi:hypothetical protein
MPNGGSDCCGTCPFNRKNRGQSGYAHANDPGPDHCEIRDLAIEHSFYTYCANHPHHNTEQIRIPIGPVYHAKDGYGREVWQPAPDTPEVRTELLRLLALATPAPIPDYPAGHALIEAAILHAGELDDLQFVPEFDRIRQFPEFEVEAEGSPTFSRDPIRSAMFASGSLERLLPPAEIQPFVNSTVRALAEGIQQSGDVSGLPALADALQEAGCTHAPTLEYLRGPLAQPATAQHPCWIIDVILGRAPVQYE